MPHRLFICLLALAATACDSPTDPTGPDTQVVDEYRADNVLFTSITMNPAWVHLDFDYAENETEFGQPLVNSMLTVAMVVGISVHETTLGTTVANLGFKEITFPAPDAVPPICVPDAPSRCIPVLLLPSGAVPVTSVPM